MSEVLSVSNVSIEPRLKAKGRFAAVAVAAGLAVSSVLGSGAPKTQGPYEAAAYEFSFEGAIGSPATNMLAELRVADAKPLELSSSLNGIFMTKGYTVYTNLNAAEKALQPDEVAVIELHQESTDHFTGEPIKANKTQVIVPPNGLAQKRLLSAEQRDFLHDAELSSNGNIDTFKSPSTSPADRAVALGNFPSHAAKPVQLIYSEHQFLEDGSMQKLSEQTVAATVKPNVDCGPESPPIASEVVLSKKQQKTLCNTITRYDGLMQSDVAVNVTTAYAGQQGDSANGKTQTVALTYPYVDNREVATLELDQLTLHEFLHLTYAESAPSITKPIEGAYEAVMDTMQYQMPSEDLQAGSDVKVNHAEEIWAIMTESTYYKPEDRVGHPWGNPTEMASSLAAVMAFYPEAFIKKYAQLSQRQKEVVTAAASATIGLIESTTTPVGDVIPYFGRIADTLQLGEDAPRELPARRAPLAVSHRTFAARFATQSIASSAA